MSLSVKIPAIYTEKVFFILILKNFTWAQNYFTRVSFVTNSRSSHADDADDEEADVDADDDADDADNHEDDDADADVEADDDGDGDDLENDEEW